jgi:hypothetical protein
MPFSSWPLTFGHDLAETVGHIRSRLSPRQVPRALYHCTSTDGVLGIIDSKTLRATCVEDLKDQSEIYNGIEMIQAEVQRGRNLSVGSFPQQVLSLLSEALNTRRSWTFVACFRAKRGAKRVVQEYGPYCLQFDTFSNWEPRLRLPGLQADIQYHRVIYESARKCNAIQRAIDSIIILAAKNSRGDLRGPWAESIARIHARTASQSLMNIIASFKHSTFEWEDEWRIVCRPRCSIAGSAPDMADDGFRPLIKTDATRSGKRFVELRLVQQENNVIRAFPGNAIPFSRIYVCDDSGTGTLTGL